jgi:hypothetical protein
VDLVKEVVKRLKKDGLGQLSHHDLAIGLTTIGFKEVCKEFGAEWSQQSQTQALGALANSEYDLSWLGRSNNPNYVPFLQLCARGDIEKVPIEPSRSRNFSLRSVSRLDLNWPPRLTTSNGRPCT